MNNNNDNKVIDPEKYEVFILHCPAHVPFNFSIHPWFVCNEKGKISRWEVLFRANKDETWGFLHQNHYPPFSGIEIFAFSPRWYWRSHLLKKVEGEMAKEMIDFIKMSRENYPYVQKYVSSGTNSSTYVQWVLNHFDEIGTELPWNAIGKNAK